MFVWCGNKNQMKETTQEILPGSSTINSHQLFNKIRLCVKFKSIKPHLKWDTIVNFMKVLFKQPVPKEKGVNC